MANLAQIWPEILNSEKETIQCHRILPRGLSSDGMGVGAGIERQLDSSRLLETELDNKQNGGGRKAGSGKDSSGEKAPKVREALLALVLGREKTNGEKHRPEVLEVTAPGPGPCT